MKKPKTWMKLKDAIRELKSTAAYEGTSDTDSAAIETVLYTLQDSRKRERTFRLRYVIAYTALKEIAGGTCCESCEPGEPRCYVATAKEALKEIKELKCTN